MKKMLVLFVVCAILAIFLAVCSKPSSSGGDSDDNIPPNRITDLTVTSVTTNSITLQWTAPGDDDTVGFAVEYDIRISADSITAANFAQATRFDAEVSPFLSHTIQQFTIVPLEPDSAYYFALKSTDEAENWSEISNCAMGRCAAVITVAIPDTALERIVRAHIHKPNGAILSSDVDTVTQLDARNSRVYNITGLEYFTRLNLINISSNEITDITPLTDLMELSFVDITFNHISNLTPLADHLHIQTLYAGINPIDNISPLSTLTYLRQLWLYETGLGDGDFEPLYGLTHLEDIHFASLGLTTLDFMSHLTHVRIAQLGMNYFTSVAPLAGDTALVGLGLDFSDITDLAPLTGLHNLNGLSIRDNNVSDLQPLVDNQGIASGDMLYLYDNPLSQVSIDSLIPILEDRGVIVYR
jgi:Leucine-rich repeat (LRR) protein